MHNLQGRFFHRDNSVECKPEYPVGSKAAQDGIEGAAAAAAEALLCATTRWLAHAAKSTAATMVLGAMMAATERRMRG